MIVLRLMLTALFSGVALAVPTAPLPSASAPEPEARTAFLRHEIAAANRNAEGGPAVAADLARLHYYLGEQLADPALKRQSYRDGIAFAEKAAKAAPGLAAAKIWAIANQGALRKLDSDARTAAWDPERELLEARRLDAAYGFGAADRELGALYASESVRKAEGAFRAALSRYPDHPGNQAYYARFLLESRGECAEALKLARQVTGAESRVAEKFPLEAPQWLEISRTVVAKTESRCGR